MKITEEELIAELEDIIDMADLRLRVAHDMGFSQNSIGVGIQTGERDCAQKILDLIRKGFTE